MCLPSMWEAFGMVVLESWASGTPVVVTRHGAFPELIADNPHLGVMFDPKTDGFETTNSEGLAEACSRLRYCQPAERCSRVPNEIADLLVGSARPQFEQLYHQVMK